MILPSFNHNRTQWDRYTHFYCDPLSGYRYSSLFHQFSTGELRINYLPEPDERRTYTALNLQLVTTSDSDCPKLYHPATGKLVPKAHLNESGQQHLCIDLDTGKAWCMGRGLLRKFHLVPAHFDGARIAWLAQGQDPVTAEAISISAPDEDYKAEHKQAINGLRAACKMVKILNPSILNSTYHPRPVHVSDLLGKTVADLTAQQVRAVIERGVVWPRKVTRVPYLLLHPVTKP